VTTVYIVVHDDGWGEGEIRGVYDSRDGAEASIVTRTPSGRRSTSLDAHNERCCTITERELLSVQPIEDKG
jgi:hypothetical protein